VLNPSLLKLRNLPINVRDEDDPFGTLADSDGATAVPVAAETDPEAAGQFVIQRVCGETVGTNSASS
jgi:hypothetical protein